MDVRSRPEGDPVDHGDKDLQMVNIYLRVSRDRASTSSRDLPEVQHELGGRVIPRSLGVESVVAQYSAEQPCPCASRSRFLRRPFLTQRPR